MGVEGPRRVGGGVSGCRGPIGPQPWLQTTGMPGPHPRPPEVGRSGGPQMATSGAAGPQEPTREQSCPGHPPPLPMETVGHPGPTPSSAHQPAWPQPGEDVRAGSPRLGANPPPLWVPISVLPSPGRARGQLRSGWRFLEGHSAKCDYGDYKSSSRAEALTARPPAGSDLWPSKLACGRDP